MKGVMWGLLAIPLLIALVTLPGGAQACAGGEPGHTYFEQNMNVTAGNYTAKQFNVDKNEGNLHVGFGEHTKVFILSDAQMTNFQSGKNFTVEYNSSTDPYRYVNLTKGKYWTVVDNRASTVPVNDKVTVERYALKGCGDPAPISSLPEFQGTQVIVALVLVAGAVVLARKTRTK